MSSLPCVEQSLYDWPSPNTKSIIYSPSKYIMFRFCQLRLEHRSLQLKYQTTFLRVKPAFVKLWFLVQFKAPTSPSWLQSSHIEFVLPAVASAACAVPRVTWPIFSSAEWLLMLTPHYAPYTLTMQYVYYLLHCGGSTFPHVQYSVK